MGAPTHAAAVNKADNNLNPTSPGTMVDGVVGCSRVSSDEGTSDATSSSSESLKLLTEGTIFSGDALEYALCILLKRCATSSHSSGS